jgi:F-type H+-transporting ATPase subunit alpha
MEEQAVAIYAGINGYLDPVPVGQVPRFQDELRETLRADGSVYAAIKETGAIDEETEAALKQALERFAHSFSVEEEAGLLS